MRFVELDILVRFLLKKILFLAIVYSLSKIFFALPNFPIMLIQQSQNKQMALKVSNF